MRAAVLHTYGGPDVLNIEQRPEPALRDTDILIEVHATSVNPVDTKVRQTGGGGGRTLPLILGYDVSGVVVRCGSNVKQWKAGDVVFAAPNLFRDGANADYVAIDGQLVTILGSGTGDRGRGLLYKNVTLHYEFMGIPTAHEIEPERPGQILTGIAQLVDSGLLKPWVSQRLPLERIAQGHRQVETSRTIGKVAIALRQ